MRTLGEITDKVIKDLWKRLEDVTFIEDTDSNDSSNLILASDFYIWLKGTERDRIWKWFNDNYSKGIQGLTQ
jgi:hypothetical protein